jgi:hypothetical protein
MHAVRLPHCICGSTTPGQHGPGCPRQPPLDITASLHGALAQLDAERRANAELTALLERALQAATGAPSVEVARATYAAVEAELADDALVIQCDDGTVAQVAEVGGAL